MGHTNVLTNPLYLFEWNAWTVKKTVIHQIPGIYFSLKDINSISNGLLITTTLKWQYIFVHNSHSLGQNREGSSRNDIFVIFDYCVLIFGSNMKTVPIFNFSFCVQSNSRTNLNRSTTTNDNEQFNSLIFHFIQHRFVNKANRKLWVYRTK